jgi:PKD repeat protein
VGSDTNWIGDTDYRRDKIAFFPLAAGVPVASNQVPALPAGVYLGAAQSGQSATNVLHRVNAGGSAVQSSDSGPDWTDGSGFVAGGNNAGWSPVPTVRPEVPSTTPRVIFDSERWAEQHWTFPVPAGAQVQVRLYFANRYPGTAQVGQRVFNVGINGTTVLPNYDIVADVGNDTGTMKAFGGLTASGDGNVHVDFTPVVENPLINGIEIVRTDVPAPPATTGALTARSFDGTTAGAEQPVASPLDWSQVRGATLIGGTLFYGKTDSNLYKRSFDGTTFGAEQLLDPYNDPKWSTVSVGGGSSTTFRGTKPSFNSEIPNLTSLFYDGKGKLFYTLFGQSGLYSRAFSPDSGVVHNHRATTATLADAGGAFLSGNQLYYVTKSNGNLNRTAFNGGAPGGGSTVVSGPGVDGVDWRAKVVFLGPGAPANQPPAAGIAVSCMGLDCTGDGTSSTDQDGTISSYAWNWGDGATSTGPTASHTYGAAGTYTVTLTVTDDDGESSSVTRSVTVAPPVASPIAFRGTAGVNTNSAAPAFTAPAAVQAGDALALLVTTKTGVTHTPPAGWTQVAQSPGTAAQTSVWQKVATGSDAGSSVAVTLSELTKVDVRLLAYSGTAASVPVSAVISSDASLTTDHPAPTSTVSTPGSWVVWYWADKSPATTTSWTAPADTITRSTSFGTGTTYISSLVADPGQSSAVGSVPGPTASTNAASRGNGVALVLKPA